jgi:hypothetical protein
MTLNDIYLVSQVLAVFALVPSVIYLAVQVRQNTLQARASASFQYLEAGTALNMPLIENKQMASVVRRGYENYDALDADEKVQFGYLIGQWYQTFSAMYDLMKSGMLPENTWYPIRKHLISMMSISGTRTIWETYAREGISPDFVAYVDALESSDEKTYTYNELIDASTPEKKAKPEGEQP